MNIALYFGSFNPIHTGHLIIANQVLNTKKFDQVWFVVSPLNPFKKEKDLLNEQARFRMVKKGISGNPGLKASNIEFDLPRPSYTIDTLSRLSGKFPKYIFSIVMGSDSYRELHKWKEYKTIISNYKILIYTRPGFEKIKKLAGRIEILNAPLLGISSTEIRRLIAAKKSVRYLVPEQVRKEIEKNNFYRK